MQPSRLSRAVREKKTSSRYTLLFSHGNAVDLGQMCSFYIGLGSRINCNIWPRSTALPCEKSSV